MRVIKNIVNILFGTSEKCFHRVRIKGKNFDVSRILSDPEMPGKTKAEIIELFGEDKLCNTFTDRWAYHLKSSRRKKYYLVFYFEDGKLLHIRYKYKIMM